MNQNKFGTDEAVQYVLDTGSESELSELEKSDFEENTDITIQVLPRIREIEEEIEEEETEKEEKEKYVIIDNEQNSKRVQKRSKKQKI